jgi:hypothetical protein
MIRGLICVLVVIVSPFFASDKFIFKLKSEVIFDSYNRATGTLFLGATILGPEDRLIGEVILRKETEPKYYQYNQDTGIISFIKPHSLSLYSLSRSLHAFKVYDSKHHRIGKIRGKWTTGSTAEFIFFDHLRRKTATLKLNREHNQIRAYDMQGQLLAFGSRRVQGSRFYEDRDHFEVNWDIDIFPGYTLDKRLLWPLLGYISDVWLMEILK